MCKNEKRIALLVSNKRTSVMLQTASGIITDVKEDSHVAIRILFLVLAEDVRYQPNCKVIVGTNLNTEYDKKKAFGKDNERSTEVDKYEFCLKTDGNRMNVYVKALDVPEICSGISGQYSDVAKIQHTFLDDLM